MTSAAAMVLCSTLLTACGDSAADDAGGGGTVTVGVAGNIFDVPLRVAEAQGYFSKRGLHVRFVTVTAATGTPALQSGSLQILNSSPTSFLGALAKGLPEIAVGADGLGNPLGLVVSNTFAQQQGLTAKSPSDEVAKALAGSTGGSSSANTKAEAEIFLRNNGVGPGEVEWVSLPSPSADRAALDDGRIDWFITSEPLPLQIQHSGEGVVVATSRSVPEWAGQFAGYGQVLVTNKGFADQHTGTVEKFAAAVQEGTAYLAEHANDPSVVPVAKEALPGVPDPVVQAGLEEVEWPLFADMDAATWRKTFTFVDKLGALPAGAEITTDDWTNTYLR
ncbi:ABC transporter substrate-binding protein [Streptomyces sp. NPDC102441]|uniref:ABC transporter substrate-binding protein n=1 Tax=Streptomyces sp. NPDC102441 TaxID=3366176 RepID=UPI003815897B